jgi:hypothetical protein
MTSVVLWHALLAAGLLPTASPVSGDLSCTEATVSARSVWAPPGPRELTRVVVVARPFLGLVANTWGAISEARVEHYFAKPFMLGVEMAPVAIAVDSTRGAGAITHLRVHGAYVTDFLAIGFGVGERLRRFGTSGVSLSPTLRLGALDGLNLAVSFSYVVARNPYSGRPTLGFSNVAGTLSVPLTQRLAAALDAGFSLDVWAFFTLGLRQRLTGDGGPGSWYVSGAFGLAGVSDRTVCRFEGGLPCPSGSALSYGPTVSAGLERRF